MLSKDYLVDAQRLIKLAAPHIKATMTHDDAIQGALFLSLGVEKLLKHVLAEINPVFILKVADFKHSAPSLYSDRMFADGKNSEIVAKPDSDVVTFRVSLSRSRAFSKTANTYSNMLHTLSNYRDIIAHRPTSELDLKITTRMLQKDAFPLISAFAEELRIPPSGFFGSEEVRLRKLSQDLTDRDKFEQEMNQLLDEHLALWKSRSSDAELVSRAKDKTAALMKQFSTKYSYEGVACPACNNVCLVRLEPDYDYADGESYLSGVYVEELHCYFCDLELETYEALNFVDVDGLLASTYP